MCLKMRVIGFHLKYFRRIGTTTLIESVYNSSLTTDISTYLEECYETPYYYQSILICILKEGQYDLVISSAMGISAKVYKNNFNPIDLDTNLLQQYHGDCSAGQIKFINNFSPDKVYYLIVARTSPNTTFSYSVVSTGSSHINFNQSSEYDCFSR